MALTDGIVMGAPMPRSRPRSRTKRSQRPLTWGAIALGALCAFTATSAAAAPSPDHGPTSGGTLVTGSVPAISFTEVSSGFLHSAALGSDGAAYTWGGYPDLPLLGNGTTLTSAVPVPVTMPADVRFTSVLAGNSQTFAFDTAGDLWGWGSGTEGQLGTGRAEHEPVPVPIPTPADVTFTSVTTGFYPSFALGSDGAIYAWGSGSSLTLGTGSTASVLSPTRITPEGTQFIDVSGGTQHAIALDATGNVWGWGSNLRSELGDPHVADGLPKPLSLPGLPPGTTFTQAVARDHTNLALTAEGAVWAWGDNQQGLLGTAVPDTLQHPEPLLVPFPEPISSLAEGFTSSHAVAQGESGTFYFWGSNAGAGAGNGTNTGMITPPIELTPPPGLVYTQVSVGWDVLALTNDPFRPYGWGINTTGGAGVGVPAGMVLTPTPLAVQPTLSRVSFGETPGTSPVLSNGTSWSVVSPTGCGPVPVTTTWSQFGVERTQTSDTPFTFGEAPAVTLQPEPATLPSGGGMYSTSAAASGESAPTVQWQIRQGDTDSWSDIPGATQPDLTTEISETSWVRAVFTNCWETPVYSDPARVLVPLANDTSSPPNTGGSASGGSPGGISGGLPGGAGGGNAHSGALATTGFTVPAWLVAVGGGGLLLGVLLSAWVGRGARGRALER